MRATRGVRGIRGLIGFLLSCFLVFQLSLGGCDAAGDLARKAIGAPSREQIAAAEQQVQQKADEIEQLQTSLDQAAEQQTQAEAQAEQARERGQLIQTQIASVSAQLGTTPPGPVFDSLSRVFDDLRTQFQAVNAQADQYAALAGQWAAKIATWSAQLDQQRDDLEDAWLALQGFDEQTSAKLKASAAGVKLIGSTVQDLGVPGAQAIGEKASNLWETLLAALIGGGTIGTPTLLAYRKAKRKSDGLEQVVRVNEDVGLLDDVDPAKKAEAKARLSENAKAALAVAKSGV